MKVTVLIMASATLPSYPAFDTDEEISSLPQKWEEWVDGLEDLLAAVNITDHERKWSTLKFYGGEKLRKLEKQLTYDRTAVYGANAGAEPPQAGTPDHYRRLKEARHILLPASTKHMPDSVFDPLHKRMVNL